jgi:signal transduction histidine kinase
MFERAPEATVVVEDDGRVVLINAAARKLTGLDVDRFFRSPLARDALVTFRAELRTSGRAQHDVRATTSRGPRWLSFEGRTLGPYYVIVIRDTTSERAREIDLQALRAREAARERRDGAAGASSRGANDRLEINDAVLEAQPLLTLVAGTSVDVRLALDPEAGTVALDRARLEHILLNLAASARAAMPGGGTLTISTAALPGRDGRDDSSEATRGFVMLTVTDNGEGLSADEREQVFEGFLARTDPSHGSQLGLLVARRAVQHSGGCLSVRSSPEQGTSVVVYLPQPGTTAAARAGACVYRPVRWKGSKDSAPSRESATACCASKATRR